MNVEQLKYEVDAWLRVFEFIKQENVYLRNRLAGILQNKIDKNFLDKAEDFQNSFLNKDAILALLKNEIYAHKQLLTNEINHNEALRKEVLNNQKKLRIDVEKLTKEFSGLKINFNNCIDEISSTYQFI